MSTNDEPQVKVLVLHPDYVSFLSKLKDLETGETGGKTEVYATLGPAHEPELKSPKEIQIENDEDHSNLTSVDSCPSLTYDREKLEKKIKRIHCEMVNYEKRLLESLRILKLISDQIIPESTWRDTQTLCDIFKDIPLLYSLHQNISDDFNEITEGNSEHFLPSVFKNSTGFPNMNIYQSFICRYSQNFHKLAVILSKDKEFSDFCKSCIETSQFEEQRIQDVFGMYFGVHCSLTRFRLLISKLHQELPEHDERFKETESALKCLSNLLLNSEGEMIRQDQISLAHLALNKIDGLHFTFDEIPPLLREGPCKKISRRSMNKPTMDRHLFLFSNYLVLTEPPSPLGRYQVKSETILKNMKLSQIGEDDEIGIPHSFRIRAQNLCVQVAFSNNEEKKSWWDAIQSAIEEENMRETHAENGDNVNGLDLPATTGSTAVEWIRDEHATMCAECSTEFTMFNRRHHCRACGQVFCSSCSDYQAPIAYLNGKFQRVCEADYHLIYGEMLPGKSPSDNSAEHDDEDSKTVQKGHLLSCQYTNGTWSLKPIHRSALCTSYIKHVKVMLSPTSKESAKTPSTKTGSSQSLPEAGDTTDHGSGSSPPTSQAYLSRVFCDLHVDTLLSIFAARADSRPRVKFPLLGTRLIYMDEAKPDLGKKRSSSCGNLDAMDKTPQLFQYCKVPSKDEGQPSSPVNTTTTGNPIYRNRKPPPPPAAPVNSTLSSEPQTNTAIVDSLRPLRERLQMAAGHIDSIAAKGMRMAPKLLGLLEQLQANQPSGSRVVNLSNATEEVDSNQQLESVSPMVIRMLRNRLGFILLPMNSDIIAYYFEAQTLEMRNRWINAIRHTCLAYMNQHL